MINKYGMRNSRKNKNLDYHFKKRWKLRVGDAKVDTKHLVSRIRKGRLIKVEDQSNRVKKYAYSLNGVDYILVYDRIRQKLITILLKSKKEEIINGQNNSENNQRV